jgi:DNA-binding FrmR family transcriptional regulator
MSTLRSQDRRKEIVTRLKRAEGQLRGVQRMIDEGEACHDIAGQLSAVRKAIDSVFVHMTLCFMEQEIKEGLGDTPKVRERLAEVMEGAQTMLARAR